MSAIGTAVAALDAALVTAGCDVRLTSDLLTDQDRIAAGAPMFSIAWAYTGVDRTVSSNERLYGYQLTIWIRKRLDVSSDEQEWTSDNLCESLIRAIGNPTWYSAIGATFYGFQTGDDALVLTAPEREGNVVSYSARAKILLNA